MCSTWIGGIFFLRFGCNLLVGFGLLSGVGRLRGLNGGMNEEGRELMLDFRWLMAKM